MTTKVPFKEGLFEEANGRGALLASKCGECGQVFFPTKSVCLNCTSTDLEKINLSTHGKLYSYTTVQFNSAHFQAPYTIGWIDLPEGARILSQIRGWREQPLKIGMDMRLSIETLWEADGKEAVGYVFRPAGMAGGDQL